MENRSINQKGSVLVLALVVMIMILFLAGVFLQLTLINIMLLERSLGVDKAYWIAIAGMNQKKHDLKEYYFHHQMGYTEKEFAGGKYKVGTATLIGQGFHRSIIVSMGEYQEHRKCIYKQLSMNTPTDYLFFFEGRTHNFRNHNAWGNPIYGGPVHVNGDIYVGHGGSDVIFIKSNKDYGPVISCSGTIYSANDTYWDWQNRWCAFGEGEIKNPFSFNRSNVPSNFTTAYYSATDKGLVWPGNSGVGQPLPQAYNHETYPTFVYHTGPDGSEYKYPLVQHKENGAPYIKVPKTTQIDERYFKKWINKDWYIEDFNWSNPAASITYITDEQRPSAGWGVIPQKFKNINFGGGTGFTIEFEKERDPRFIRHIYLRPSDPEVWTLENNYYWTFERFINARVYWDSTLTDYYIDIENNKAVFNYNASLGQDYQGIEWDGFYFKSDPIGGKWRGRRVNWRIGTSSQEGVLLWANGTKRPAPNQSFLIYESVSVGQALSKYSAVNVPDSHPDAEKIYVGGSLYFRAPNNSIASLPDGDSSAVYEIDFTNGVVKFGDYNQDTGTGKGLRPPVDAEIRATWCHDFQTPIEVWLPKMYKVIKINLDKIDEINYPKDPNYPDDDVKFGIIYSKVPLHIMGTPKVPVTIVCEDDVYLGPINSPRLNERLEVASRIGPDYNDDSDSICPVAIICKKILTLDMTYAPQRYSTSKLYNNTFVPWEVVR